MALSKLRGTPHWPLTVIELLASNLFLGVAVGLILRSDYGAAALVLGPAVIIGTAFLLRATNGPTNSMIPAAMMMLLLGPSLFLMGYVADPTGEDWTLMVILFVGWPMGALLIGVAAYIMANDAPASEATKSRLSSSEPMLHVAAVAGLAVLIPVVFPFIMLLLEPLMSLADMLFTRS